MRHTSFNMGGKKSVSLHFIKRGSCCERSVCPTVSLCLSGDKSIAKFLGKSAGKRKSALNTLAHTHANAHTQSAAVSSVFTHHWLSLRAFSYPPGEVCSRIITHFPPGSLFQSASHVFLLSSASFISLFTSPASASALLYGSSTPSGADIYSNFSRGPRPSAHMHARTLASWV